MQSNPQERLAAYAEIARTGSGFTNLSDNLHVVLLDLMILFHENKVPKKYTLELIAKMLDEIQSVEKMLNKQFDA